MPRRPGELSIRRPLVAPRRPRIPGAEAAREDIRPFAGTASETPIRPEQNEALLERFEAWRARWNGSLIEFIVWEYLTVQKKQIPQVDFAFQSPFLGGRTLFGGFIADFAFPSRLEIWMVQGIRFHLQKPEDRATTFGAEAQLSSLGWKVLELWEDDLLTRPQFVLDLAWTQGADVPERKFA